MILTNRPSKVCSRTTDSEYRFVPMRRRPEHHPDVQQYLRTGCGPPLAFDWNGRNIIEKEIAQKAAMKEALIEAVRERATRSRRKLPELPLDLPALTLQKVEPMVRGFFPAKERGPVLRMFEKAVVFLTPENVELVLRETTWPSTAWSLANLYLASLKTELLSDEAVGILGLSEGTTCFVSLDYLSRGESFGNEGITRFEDFLVHEAAHVFHNCKRGRIGLEQTRRKEWLLDIEFEKREMFAYACEAYCRILELGRTAADRRALFAELEEGKPLEQVDSAEYIDILREAVGARNGFKRILARCAPPRRKRLSAKELAHQLYAEPIRGILDEESP